MTGQIPDGIDNLALLEALDISGNTINDTEIPRSTAGAGWQELLLIPQHLLRDDQRWRLQLHPLATRPGTTAATLPPPPHRVG